MKLYKVSKSRSGCKLKINHSRCYNTPYMAGTVCTFIYTQPYEIVQSVRKQIRL